MAGILVVVRRQIVWQLLLFIGQLFKGVPAVVDFTCITKPRIDISNEDTFIAAYLHGHGGGANLSFDRTTYTHTNPKNRLWLPTSGDRLEEPDGAQVLRLPAVGGKARIGAFACNAGITGRSDISVGTVIMSKNADFLPTRVSQTVNRGEAFNLTITATDPTRTFIRWRKDGSEPDRDRNGRMNFDFANGTISDTGIYEVYLAFERSRGNQALMRLIVRGCNEHKWNAPQCDADCPVCLNGGVCDDLSGDCTCPPGFSGDFCETPVGFNRFGQSGSFRCDSAELGGGPTCEGMLFCLPDPYGCSCAAGYQGIDCDETCADGFYGANCAQTCHCMDGAACDGTTGECPGDCAPGYAGINCQVCDNDTFGRDCRLCHCMDGAACDKTTGDCPEDSVPVSNCPVPVAAPEINNVLWSNEIVRLSWHSIPCGKRGGDITGYTYELRDASGSIIEANDTTAESVEVEGLTQGASYSFRLRAFTRVGPGPWKDVNFVFPSVDRGNCEALRSDVSDLAFVGLGVVIGIMITVATALLITFGRLRRRRTQTKRSESTSPNQRGSDDSDAIYFDVNDDVEMKKISATPAGVSTVPPKKSTSRASTKRPTTKATKKTKMAASQGGTHLYETTIIP